MINDVYCHFHFIKNFKYSCKSQMFETSDCTITVHNDLYYNKLVN